MHASFLLSIVAALAPLAALGAPVTANETAALSSLEARAIYKPCKSANVCGKMALVANSHHICNKGFCDWGCNSGYKRYYNKCVRTKSSGSPSSQNTANTDHTVNLAASSSSSSGAVAAAGVSKFLGTNTGAIASWFHTNSAQDSTNGHSWCYFPYNDNTPGFAISLNTMMSDAGWDATKAREMYCGLEAVVTTPSGKSLTLYVTDAFDDTWVRTPTSIDVVFNAFGRLLGYTTEDKNTVIQNVSWRFTGNRNNRYKYNGVGN
ncbi:uncharacterized protein JCM10292_006138 [Rhodotorula paludigena]|uniref:uncharacterized protein n=1 Tax=Rhodotorula paludigena TaxID=86838 RepID=UPI0031755FC4